MEIRRGRSAGSIRTEGGLLPSDLLEKIRAADPDVPGLRDADFGLASGDRAREATTRAWNRLVGAWAALEAVRVGAEASDPLVGPTRDRFLLPLFEELGFGRLPVTRAVEIDGTSYPISHNWQDRVPVHLVGYGVELDSRTKGVRGAAGAAPHALVQEYLNRADGALWGIVSNGRTLRLLRDSTSLTRQAYVEFDLEAIFEGELYADFALLWSVLHRSRFDGDKPADCLLERWTNKAADDGTRALEKLRGGVEKAIETLGAGFLTTKGNAALVEALRSGELDPQDYYRELLRLVYRLIFLFTAEDRRDEETGRELLLDPAAPEEAAERYRRYYSTVRLRSFAGRRRGSRHPDLWVSLRRVVAALGSDGAPSLALPALGSFLFGPEACRHLDASELTNESLLDAVRALAAIEEDRRLRLVDYRNLGAEELGGIYEGLLELHPRIELDANPPRFSLGTAAGNERKSTGSYYTPSSLISCLLDSALDPVVDEVVKGKTRSEAEAAILGLAVVDPAAGSGHFLIAAAHRLAKQLAAIRSGEGEPPPAQIRHALRDVIARCIYAVDINPMAVELCKVSLWLEALEPGRPLSFLDTHVKRGNSLLGTTPELAESGVPDMAFEPIAGDEKAVATAWRKRNAQERTGQQALFEAPLTLPTAALATALRSLDALPEDSPAAVEAKARRFAAYEASSDYSRSRAALDAWCTAFVAYKASGAPEVTTAAVRSMAADPARVPAAVRAAVDAAGAEYGFFHWPIEFPAVFERGGFDVVLGNPPWGQTELEEKEWFASRRPDIAAAPNAATRKKMIDALGGQDPGLHGQWLRASRYTDGQRKLLSDTGRYPLCGRGRINSYAVFAEVMRSLIGPTGRAGAIVPSGIATDDTTKHFFRDLVERGSLASLFEFANEGFFPSVGQGHMNRFCLLTVAGNSNPVQVADFVFRGAAVADLSDVERHFSLTADEFALLNPNTWTCPIFRTRLDAEITKAIYRRVPVLVNEMLGAEGSPWRMSFKQGLFNMATDSGLFRTREQLEAEGWQLGGNVFSRGDEASQPLYEAKMTQQFTHRFGDYELVPAGTRVHVLPEVPVELLMKPTYSPVPFYWVDARQVEAALRERWSHDWMLGWRDVTNDANARTLMATVIPRTAVGDTFLLAFPQVSPTLAAALLANLNSFVLDYVARQKLGGTHLKYHVFKQLPVLPPSTYAGQLPWARGANPVDWVRDRVLELSYTAWDLAPFALDLGWDGPPFLWDPDRRSLLRAELDAAFFHLYGVDHHVVDHILDTFPIVRAYDEKAYGEYRTKRVVLEIYDAMQDAIGTGAHYQTRLDPPPGDPRAAHPPRRGEEPGHWTPGSEVLARAPQSAPATRSVRAGAVPPDQPTTTTPVPAIPETPPSLFAADPTSAWRPEAAISPKEIVMGARVRHRAKGEGTVLSVRPSGKSTELLIRFDATGESWIVFGYGVLEFRQ